MQRQKSGFTIVELLIAAAIFLIMLAALGGIFVSSNRANVANQTLAESSAQLRSAIQAIQYDVSLAGYLGSDPGAVDRSIAEPVAVQVTPTEQGTHSVAQLSVRFYDDRQGPGGLSLRTVRYSISDGQLLRGVNGGADEVLATGIVNLTLLSYRRTGLDVRAPGDTMPDDLTGFDLQIAYVHRDATLTENFSVRLVNQ